MEQPAQRQARAYRGDGDGRGFAAPWCAQAGHAERQAEPRGGLIAHRKWTCRMRGVWPLLHATRRPTLAAVVHFTRPAAAIFIIIVTVTLTAVGAHRDARAQAGLHKESAAPAPPNGGPHDFDFEF